MDSIYLANIVMNAKFSVCRQFFRKKTRIENHHGVRIVFQIATIVLRMKHLITNLQIISNDAQEFRTIVQIH